MNNTKLHQPLSKKVLIKNAQAAGFVVGKAVKCDKCADEMKQLLKGDVFPWANNKCANVFYASDHHMTIKACTCGWRSIVKSTNNHHCAAKGCNAILTHVDLENKSRLCAKCANTISADESNAAVDM